MGIHLCSKVFLKPLLSPVTLITEVRCLQQIRMAEIEQASLKSEQLSDKSSSPALPDDLSLDEHTAYLLEAREGKVTMSRVRCEGEIRMYTSGVQMGYIYALSLR